MSLVDEACALIDTLVKAFVSFKAELAGIDFNRSINDERIAKLKTLIQELETLEDITGGTLSDLVENICQGEEDESNSGSKPDGHERPADVA